MKNFHRRIMMTIMCLVVCISSVSAEEITIVGTGSGVSILKALGDAFHQANPDVTITLPESIGTSGGIKAVGRDEALLGRVAREIKENEKSYGLTYIAYAKCPVVFFVNKSVTVKNLSIQQILDIYSGKLTNWKEVGGTDAKIRVVRRPDGDNYHDILLKLLPGFKDITLTPNAKIAATDPEAEATIFATEGSIAYGSYSNVKNLDVTILTTENKSPAEPDFPYITVLGFVYKEKNYTGAIKRFIEFAKSEAARDIIINAGGSPL